MRRGAIISLRVLAGLLGVAVMVAAVLLIGLNSAPGRRLAERLVAQVTGGQVMMRGLGGRFPDRIALAGLDIQDAGGVWLKIGQLTVDWSPLRLIAGELRIDDVRAGHIDLRRLPQTTGATTGPSSAPPSGDILPFRLTVSALRVDRIEIDAPVVDRSSAFSLKGSLHLSSARQGSAALEGTGLDAPGRVTLNALLDRQKVDAHMAVQEPPGGLLAGMAGLPDLGELSVDADLQGPSAAAGIRVTAKAGDLDADVRGTADLAAGSLALDVEAQAPAMAPRPGLSWQSIRLTAAIRGAIGQPDAQGRLDIEGLAAGGASLQSLTADLGGNAGEIVVKAALSSLRIPGPNPALLAAAPLVAEATVDLADPKMPAALRVSHPLFAASGRIDLDDPGHGEMTLSIPALAPLAAAAGVDLAGHARVDARMTATADGGTSFTVNGTLGLEDGALPYKALLGEDAILTAGVLLRGDDIAVEQAALDGKVLHLTLNGKDHGGVLDVAWTAAMSDLAVLRSGMGGTLSATGRLQGTADDLSAEAEATGDVSVAGRPKSPLSLSLHARGLPRSPAGEMTLHGTFAGAPLGLALAAETRGDGLVGLTIRQGRWKSAEMAGGLVVDPNGRSPEGEIRLRMARLADLQPFLGQAVGGRLEAAVVLTGKAGQPAARMTATASDLALSGVQVGRLAANGTFMQTSGMQTSGMQTSGMQTSGAQPSGRSAATLHVAAAGLQAGGVSGELSLDAAGPLDRLGLHVAADVRQGERTAHLGGDATLESSHSRLTLTALQVRACGKAARLLAPARLDFADGLSLDRLQIGLAQATLDLSGRLSPRLDLHAALKATAADVALPCLASPVTQGTLAADVRLAGTPASPDGAVRLEAHGLKLHNAGTLAPADVSVNADIRGQLAHVEGAVHAGKAIELKVAGDAPLSADGALNLRAAGTMDLAPFDAFLSAGERSVAGSVTLDATLTGQTSAPCLDGTADLARGAVQDFAQGVEFHDITARLQADCGSLRILSMTAKAGSGSISVQGAVDLAAETVKVTITAQNARPLASDLLTADLDAALAVDGPLAGPLGVAGRVHIRRAEINIPETFAGQVAVLDVRRPGRDQPPPAEDTPFLTLDLALDAPEQIFVRGHGIDAEMGGRIHITGTDVAPNISGGFDLRHGTVSLASKTLDFTSGRVSFDGSGLAHKIDPTLAFVAQSTAANVTATLTIGGYADAPSIALSSVPALPQDEILAQLIFGQSVKQLGPLQIAQIAQAVASLTDVGAGIDPLNAVRRRLGLDRLSAGAGSGGSDASFQAGKYVASGVYVGAQQGTAGGTRAQVQIDVTNNLKLETTIGVGGTTGTTSVTPDNDPGNTVGLTYRFEY